MENISEYKIPGFTFDHVLDEWKAAILDERAYIKAKAQGLLLSAISEDHAKFGRKILRPAKTIHQAHGSLEDFYRDVGMVEEEGDATLNKRFRDLDNIAEIFVRDVLEIDVKKR